ncbi:MAG: hypothetical protein ACOX6V_01540 [Patescibacteria group bacterium]|jgi:hypothetical protein
MDHSAPNSPVSSQDDSVSSQTVAKLQSQITQLEEKKKHEETQEVQKLTKKQKPVDTLDKELQELIASQKKTDTKVQTVGSRDKERQEQTTGTTSPERVPVREVAAEFEPPLELKEWVEEIPNPQTVTLPKPVKDEYGEILIKSTQIARPNIVLPIDEEEIEKAFHHKVVDSIRWLAEWCHRNILLYPGRVFYKKDTQ